MEPAVRAEPGRSSLAHPCEVENLPPLRAAAHKASNVVGGTAFTAAEAALLVLYRRSLRAQLQLSRDTALQRYDHGIDGIRSALSVCLDRHPEWVQCSRRCALDGDLGRSISLRPSKRLPPRSDPAAVADGR